MSYQILENFTQTWLSGSFYNIEFLNNRSSITENPNPYRKTGAHCGSYYCET